MRSSLSLLVLTALTACGHWSNLPDLGTVPDWQLTDRSGAEFHSSQLKGHVWIADFIYTNCPGPCPMMSSRMRHIEELTKSTPSIRFVSFTVDPARDTPPALAQYAKRFDITPGRWTFLTGDAQTLDHLDRDVFHLGTVDAQLNHSTRFVLVDGHSHIRAYYRMSDEHMAERMAHDAESLTAMEEFF